jgi:hypothetical protein
MKRTDYFGELGIDGRINLKWILRKFGIRMRAGFNSLWRPVVSSCVFGRKKNLGFHKMQEIRDWQRDYQLLKKDSDTLSWLISLHSGITESGGTFLRDVFFWLYTNVSAEHVASIFRAVMVCLSRT